MTNQSASISFLQVTDQPSDSLGVPYSHVGLQWTHDTAPMPGDLVWADDTRLARLVLVDGVMHLLLVDGTSAPADGRAVRKVRALFFEEDLGYPGNLLIPAPWDQGGVHHGG